MRAMRGGASLGLAAAWWVRAEPQWSPLPVPLSPTRGEQAAIRGRIGVGVVGREPTANAPHAWIARCLNETGDPKKAWDALQKIINERRPEAARGRRLARYFAMLVLKENPQLAGVDPGCCDLLFTLARVSSDAGGELARKRFKWSTSGNQIR